MSIARESNSFTFHLEWDTDNSPNNLNVPVLLQKSSECSLLIEFGLEIANDGKILKLEVPFSLSTYAADNFKLMLPLSHLHKTDVSIVILPVNKLSFSKSICQRFHKILINFKTTRELFKNN